MKKTTENKSSSAGSRLPYSTPTCELFAMPCGLALLGGGFCPLDECPPEVEDDEDGQGAYAD